MNESVWWVREEWRKRRVGMLEDWKTGMLGFKPIVPLIQYSSIPVFHYSNHLFRRNFQWQLIKDHRISSRKESTLTRTGKQNKKFQSCAGFSSRMSTKSSSN